MSKKHVSDVARLSSQRRDSEDQCREAERNVGRVALEWTKTREGRDAMNKIDDAIAKDKQFRLVYVDTVSYEHTINEFVRASAELARTRAALDVLEWTGRTTIVMRSPSPVAKPQLVIWVDELETIVRKTREVVRTSPELLKEAAEYVAAHPTPLPDRMTQLFKLLDELPQAPRRYATAKNAAARARAALDAKLIEFHEATTETYTLP